MTIIKNKENKSRSQKPKQMTQQRKEKTKRNLDAK
jgi:hypothetical protein